MNFLAILAVLGLEQWRAFRWRAAVERAFIRLARGIERRFNGGTREQGMLGMALALLPVTLAAAGLFWLFSTLHPALGLVWNVVVLYLLLGFRRFSHAYADVAAALRAGDIDAARRALFAWRGGMTARTVERGSRAPRHRARLARFVPPGIRDPVLVHRAARAGRRGALSRGRAPRR